MPTELKEIILAFPFINTELSETVLFEPTKPTELFVRLLLKFFIEILLFVLVLKSLTEILLFAIMLFVPNISIELTETILLFPIISTE